MPDINSHRRIVGCVNAICVAHCANGRVSTYYCGVIVYDIRLRNLQRLVEDFGSPRDLADHTGADEAHIKQILRGGRLPSGKRKNVGSELARRLDDRCFLGEGWMDMPHDDSPKHPEELKLGADEQMLVALYRRAAPELRRLIRLAAELARSDKLLESSEDAKKRNEQLASKLDEHTTRRKAKQSAKPKTGTSD